MRSSPFILSEIELTPSRLNLWVEMGICLTLIVCTLFMPIHVLLKLIIGAFVFGYFLWRVRTMGWWPYRPAYISLQLDDQSWCYSEADRTYRLKKLEAVKLTGLVLFLLASTDQGKRIHFAVWRDSISESSFKALYVAFKFNRFTEENSDQKFSGSKIVSLISGAKSG